MRPARAIAFLASAAIMVPTGTYTYISERTYTAQSIPIDFAKGDGIGDLGLDDPGDDGAGDVIFAGREEFFALLPLRCSCVLRLRHRGVGTRGARRRSR